MDILHKLFWQWDLETWANVLEVVGFLFAIGTFMISLFLKSEINKLKTSYIFDKTIKNQIEKLKNSASLISQFLNDYDNNRHAIRSEFATCVSDLEDLIKKVGYRQGWKSKRLLSFIKSRRDKPFVPKITQAHPLLYYVSKYPKRIYQTTYDDIWIVYNSLIEVIRQMENIKINKAKSL